MNRRTALWTMVAVPLGARFAARQSEDGWTPLFNGRDLTGWETFLGKPHRLIDVPGLGRNEKGEYLGAIGVDRDPKQVFAVEEADGAPAIRISGEIYGALTSRREFANYHLRFEFKWGERKWPPREQAVRDSGCCYHCVGPHGASYGYWMQSFEFQVQEGDCGDFYALAGVIVDVEAAAEKPGDPKSELVYSGNAPKVVGHTKRIIRNPRNEKPHGQWNTLELYCSGGSSVHVVNGVPNMALTGLRRRLDGREVPLERGRIQLQSEGAEIFYRNVAIRPIREIPREISPPAR